MCGLVGWSGPGPLNRALLAAAAAEAAERGPHSHGWAWYSTSWERSVGLGPLQPPPVVATTSGVLVGHSRLATTGSRPGDRPPAGESQPFIGGDWCVAHNGTLDDPDVLAGGRTVVDSEAILAALIADGEPAIATVAAHCASSPHAILIASSDRLLAIRWAGPRTPPNPLWAAYRAEGVYVASRPFTADCKRLPEGVTVIA